MKGKKIFILGTVGVPANYGGFETLVENLLLYYEASSVQDSITVYCSAKNYISRRESYLSARLKYLPLNANGVQSIPYDIISLFSSVFNRADVILLLGVSGAIALPLIRLISSARIITNIDGIEWRRQKWRGLAKWFLRISEKIAVRFSDDVIADNADIAEYVQKTYGLVSHVIAYGGDHAVAVDSVDVDDYELPESYAFSLCRIEPENNIHMILEAFSRQECHALVMVGNWNNSQYGREIRKHYSPYSNIKLFDPIFDLGRLKTLRSSASFYIHGHSAGGTNPSLVEAMHFGRPVLAFDCSFNRSTTESKALFFGSVDDLAKQLKRIYETNVENIGLDMLEVAKRRYTWNIVAAEYLALIDK